MIFDCGCGPFPCGGRFAAFRRGCMDAFWLPSRDAILLNRKFRGYRSAQPPATIRHPSGMQPRQPRHHTEPSQPTPNRDQPEGLTDRSRRSQTSGTRPHTNDTLKGCQKRSTPKRVRQTCGAANMPGKHACHFLIAPCGDSSRAPQEVPKAQRLKARGFNPVNSNEQKKRPEGTPAGAKSRNDKPLPNPRP